jgi:hypothetical protein
MKRIAISLAAMGAPALVMLITILGLSKGNFAYTLDDPYIHMALAKNIWLGRYGVNLAEYSAPSSSIVWPFLLAPFSALGWAFDYIPLVLNTVFMLMSGLLLLQVFAKLGYAVSLIFTILLMLSLNFYGLIFSGMEHSLQVLLVTVVAAGLVNAEAIKQGGHLRLAFYASLLLLPLVRYEGLAISLPVLAYVWTRGERVLPSLVFAGIALGLAGFSAFLYAHDLGWVPTSVRAKISYTSTTNVLTSTSGMTGASTALNLIDNVRKYGFLLVPVALIFIYRLKQNWSFSMMLAAVTILHFMFGKYGWYGRYEVYYLVFVLTIGWSYLLSLNSKAWGAVLAMPIAFVNLVYVTVSSPLAASNIYFQQGQMAKIVGLLDEKVAVNDLGFVSLKSHQYVLDLFGLGSAEALKKKEANVGNTAWAGDMMRVRDINYAIVYDGWFPSHPANWIKVAELKLLQKKITPADSVVAFYATSEGSAQNLRGVMKRFAEANRADQFAIAFAD